MGVAYMSQSEFERHTKRRDAAERRLYIGGGIVAALLFGLALAL